MNASLLAVLNDAERLLVAQTERAALAALDEDAAIDLEAVEEMEGQGNGLDRSLDPVDPAEAAHELLERQGPPGPVDRHYLAVEDRLRRRQLLPGEADDLGEARRHLREAAAPDPDLVLPLVELDPRAGVLGLDGGPPAVGPERLGEIPGGLGEHGEERNEDTHGDGEERGLALQERDGRDQGRVGQEVERAPHRGRVAAGAPGGIQTAQDSGKAAESGALLRRINAAYGTNPKLPTPPGYVGYQRRNRTFVERGRNRRF